MLKILLFIRIFYKQQGSILRCFSRLKFEKSLFSNTFFQFLNKMIVYTAEKGQIKYFAQNWPGKIAFFNVQTAAWFLSPFRGLESLEMYYTMNDHHTRKKKYII